MMIWLTIDVPLSPTSFVQVSGGLGSEDLISFRSLVQTANSLLSKGFNGEVLEVGALRRSDIPVAFVFSGVDWFEGQVTPRHREIVEAVANFREAIDHVDKALQFEFLFFEPMIRILGLPDGSVFGRCSEEFSLSESQPVPKKMRHSAAESVSSASTADGSIGVVVYTKKHLPAYSGTNCSIIRKFCGGDTYVWDAASILLVEYCAYMAADPGFVHYDEGVWKHIVSVDGHGVVRAAKKFTHFDLFLFTHLLLDPLFSGRSVDEFILSDGKSAFSSEFLAALEKWQDPKLKSRESVDFFKKTVESLCGSPIFEKYADVPRAGLYDALKRRNILMNAQGGHKQRNGVMLFWGVWTHLKIDI